MLLGGVDPGKSTGLAVLNPDTLQIYEMAIEELSPFHLTEKLYQWQSDYHIRTVMEDFKPRWGRAFDCTPMYLIGAAQGTDILIELVLPATHKGVVPRDKVTALMKSQGYAIGAGHSRDALSLCLYYAAFKLKARNVLEFLADNN